MTTPSRHILLVDDHGLVREGLRMLLSGMLENCQIAEAASYAQARELLASATSFTPEVPGAEKPTRKKK